MNNDLSIQNMILMLPFEQSYKEELLHKLPTLDKDRTNSVESIIRDLYNSVFSLHYEQNLQNALVGVSQSSALGDDFFAKVKAATTAELMQKLNSPDTAQLSLIGTREKLQQVISEKQPPQ